MHLSLREDIHSFILLKKLYRFFSHCTLLKLSFSTLTTWPYLLRRPSRLPSLRCHVFPHSLYALTYLRSMTSFLHRCRTGFHRRTADANHSQRRSTTLSRSVYDVAIHNATAGWEGGANQGASISTSALVGPPTSPRPSWAI